MRPNAMDFDAAQKAADKKYGKARLEIVRCSCKKGSVDVDGRTLKRDHKNGRIYQIWAVKNPRVGEEIVYASHQGWYPGLKPVPPKVTVTKKVVTPAPLHPHPEINDGDPYQKFNRAL